MEETSTDQTALVVDLGIVVGVEVKADLQEVVEVGVDSTAVERETLSDTAEVTKRKGYHVDCRSLYFDIYVLYSYVSTACY